jgi:hypothetical protein
MTFHHLFHTVEQSVSQLICCSATVEIHAHTDYRWVDVWEIEDRIIGCVLQTVVVFRLSRVFVLHIVFVRVPMVYIKSIVCF